MTPTDEPVIERNIRTLIATDQGKWLVQKSHSAVVRAWTSNGKLQRPRYFTGFCKCVHIMIVVRR